MTRKKNTDDETQVESVDEPDELSQQTDEAPGENPTLLRSESSTTLEDVPDNTPTPHHSGNEVGNEADSDDPAPPAGYVYVVHPKNGQRCLVDEKSSPELQVDGYLTSPVQPPKG